MPFLCQEGFLWFSECGLFTGLCWGHGQIFGKQCVRDGKILYGCRRKQAPQCDPVASVAGVDFRGQGSETGW